MVDEGGTLVLGVKPVPQYWGCTPGMVDKGGTLVLGVNPRYGR